MKPPTNNGTHMPIDLEDMSCIRYKYCKPLPKHITSAADDFRVVNNVTKGENAHFEKVLLFSQCFQKSSERVIKPRTNWW